MEIQILDNFSIRLRGIPGVAHDRKWAETGFRLMDEMWKRVKASGMKHKGQNVWVYEDGNRMFAGVEPEGEPAADVPLELKNVSLLKYVYYKHIGPYSGIQEAGARVHAELERKGIRTRLPYLEVYGHWGPDESKLETVLIWCLDDKVSA